MELNKKFARLTNGEMLAYLECGEGETVLLLHGNMSSSVFFQPIIEKLSGYRLLIPDLRGFGDSSYSNRFDSLRELAEDVKQFLDALSVHRVHVLGWSAGGGVALELAAAYPDLVRSLFLVSGASHNGFPLYKRNPDLSLTTEPYESKEALAADPVSVAPALAATAANNAAFFEMIYNLAIYTVNKPSSEDAKLYAQEALKQRCLVDLDWALVNFNMSNQHNGYREGDNTIGKVTCPVILTCSDKDALVPKSAVEVNLKALDKARLIEYSDCSHSPFVDCPDALAADILEFIASVS